jgi:hypothetical protein
MNSKPPGRRLDQLDGNKIRELLAAPAWGLIRDRVDDELQRARTECEGASEPAEIYRAQGRVKALRAVLQIPENLLREIRENGK